MGAHELERSYVVTMQGWPTGPDAVLDSTPPAGGSSRPAPETEEGLLGELSFTVMDFPEVVDAAGALALEVPGELSEN